MSISQGIKDYWVREVRGAINKQIVDLMQAAGNPDLVEDAKKRAILLGKQAAGVLELQEQYDALIKQAEELDRQRSELNNQSHAIHEQINRQLNKYYRMTDAGYYGYDEYNRVGKPFMREALAECGEVGVKIFELEELSEKVERRIMITTSTPEMKAFLESVFVQIGQPLE